MLDHDPIDQSPKSHLRSVTGHLLNAPNVMVFGTEPSIFWIAILKDKFADNCSHASPTQFQLVSA
ncbi:TPA: hypothetical protein DIC40_02775 [Patescibacteria group bacterium]|nr:hypothetical protein [Candidatus Gracilibacteria bacterium]